MPGFSVIDLERPGVPGCCVCSDGLSGFCSDAEIETILKEDLSDEETAQKLIDAALEKADGIIFSCTGNLFHIIRKE